jgi:hypothetical protein
MENPISDGDPKVTSSENNTFGRPKESGQIFSRESRGFCYKYRPSGNGERGLIKS